MPTKTSKTFLDPSGRSPQEVLVSGVKLAFYGLSAAVGTLAIVDGIQRYVEYANGGINQPTPYLIGIVLILGIGFTLLLIALSGAIARGTKQ